jgi:prepilin-type N-terminal cleavage/methylation domain-containing protein/prepilin-type processing-associated H-X9-DG protein
LEKENIMNKKRGFTLVELLVVIAVIALLLSILMPVLRKAKDGAMRILCGNHIKNVMLGMMMYADTHNNKIPYANAANWPWDVDRSIVTELLKSMGTDVSTIVTPAVPPPFSTPFYVPVEFSTNFYCPANARKTRYQASEWNCPWLDRRVLGYAFIWKAPWNTTPPMAILGTVNGVSAPDPSKKWVDRTDMPQASEAELVMDATLCDRGDDHVLYPQGNFGVIITGSNPLGIPDNSNHLITDAKVSGGNIGFADGHVEWRPFTEMMHRINKGAGKGPIWWWW